MDSSPETVASGARGAVLAGSLSQEAARLRRQQTLTVALLFCGYAAYYFCRVDFAVSTPLLIEELRSKGLPAPEALIRIGGISSIGVFAYAIGKLFLTGLGDFWGGRKSFLAGLAGATAFTLLFAAGGALPIFTIAWFGNRLTQSIGWAGLIKVSSRWFDYSAYGTIIGVLSVSYLVGDFGAKASMGVLIEYGFGWRSLFCFAAAVAGLLWLANFFLLRESRVELGHPEAQVSPRNVFGDREGSAASPKAILRALLFNRGFMLVCLLSLGCTIIRETFNQWTPEYLTNHAGFSPGRAASWSGIFPLIGLVSVLLAGWVSDRLGENGRTLLLLIGLAGASVALWLLAAAPAGIEHATLAVVLVGAVGFCLLGPYSYLGGAFALEFGGRQAGATSSGIIDGVGYLGGILAGDTAARIAAAYGWRGVFIALAAVSALAAVAAAGLHLYQNRRAARRG